jgi:hypothetical protein
LGGKLGKYSGRFRRVVGTVEGTSSSSEPRSSGEGERERGGKRVAGGALSTSLPTRKQKKLEQSRILENKT